MASQAKADAATAFAALSILPFTTDLTGQDLGSVGVLMPGVYKFSSSAQLTGALTLDFSLDPSESFVFQIGSALTTATASTVNVLNGNADSSIYWQVGSSATLGTSTVFAGNILADQSVTLDTSAKIICGRAIALNAAVTLDSNTVSNDCSMGGDVGTGRTDFGSLGFSGPAGNGPMPVPEPQSLFILVSALLGTGIVRMRHVTKV